MFIQYNYRAVASMYSLGGGGGGGGQKFPNDKKNSEYFMTHDLENEDAIYKQKYAYFIHTEIYY
jgi:hypothetical protein